MQEAILWRKLESSGPSNLRTEGGRDLHQLGNLSGGNLRAIALATPSAPTGRAVAKDRPRRRPRHPPSHVCSGPRRVEPRRAGGDGLQIANLRRLAALDGETRHAFSHGDPGDLLQQLERESRVRPQARAALRRHRATAAPPPGPRRGKGCDREAPPGSLARTRLEGSAQPARPFFGRCVSAAKMSNLFVAPARVVRFPRALRHRNL